MRTYVYLSVPLEQIFYRLTGVYLVFSNDSRFLSYYFHMTPLFSTSAKKSLPSLSHKTNAYAQQTDGIYPSTDNFNWWSKHDILRYAISFISYVPNISSLNYIVIYFHYTPWVGKRYLNLTTIALHQGITPFQICNDVWVWIYIYIYIFQGDLQRFRHCVASYIGNVLSCILSPAVGGVMSN